MSKKLQKRVNGGLAIYFGIGSLMSTVLCLVAIVIMAYQNVFQGANNTWGVFLMLIFLMFLSGAIAYALLRVGYDEIEN
jgi:drug/metabolite transporter (DMT)-like permease